MRLYSTSLFEYIFNFKNHYDINSAVKDIVSLRNMSREDFLRVQDKMKWEIAKYHYQNNKIYKKLVGNTFPDIWDELPIIEKKDLIGDLEDFISSPYSIDKLYINNTSGSSGMPFVFTKDYYTQSRVWAARKLFLAEYDIDFASKQAMFYRKATGFKKSLIEKIKDTLLNRYRFSVIESNDNHIYHKWLTVFKKNKFEYIYGYTSAIVLFSRYLVDNNITLKNICPTLKIVVVTAETCTEDDRKIIQKAIGVDVRNEYGSADLGMIAFECKYNHFHLVEENIYLEINENNEIIITDLHNKSFPFIRYKLGDVAKISSDICLCGNTNRYIFDFMGRSNDMVKLQNGKKVLGYAFYQRIRPILEQTNLLQEFFICQKTLNEFEIDVVTKGYFNTSTVKKLENTINDYLGTQVNIKINYLDKIQRPETGKLKHFYSEIKDSNDK